MLQQGYGIAPGNLSGSIVGDAYQAPPPAPSPLNSIHMAAGDVRDALLAAQSLMGRLVGYPAQVGATTKSEPNAEPPLFDLLGNAGMSISAQAREILACLNAINAKLP